MSQIQIVMIEKGKGKRVCIVQMVVLMGFSAHVPGSALYWAVRFGGIWFALSFGTGSEQNEAHSVATDRGQEDPAVERHDG